MSGTVQSFLLFKSHPRSTPRASCLRVPLSPWGRVGSLSGSYKGVVLSLLDLRVPVPAPGFSVYVSNTLLAPESCHSLHTYLPFLHVPPSLCVCTCPCMCVVHVCVWSVSVSCVYVCLLFMCVSVCVLCVSCVFTCVCVCVSCVFTCVSLACYVRVRMCLR